MRLSSLASFALLLLLGVTASACGTAASTNPAISGAADSGGGADPNVSSDCATPVVDYCRANPCPTSTSDVMAFAAARCADPHWPARIATIHRSECSGFPSMTMGDEFVSISYFFDGASGVLTAIYTDDDTHPNTRCLAGPTGFARPNGCSGGTNTTCSDFTADAGAGD